MEQAPPPPKKTKPTGHYINRWKRAKDVFHRIGGITTKANKALIGVETKPGEGVGASLRALQTLLDQNAPTGLSTSKRLAWQEQRLQKLGAAFANYERAMTAYLAMLAKAEKINPPGGVSGSSYAAAIQTLENELKAYKADFTRDIAMAEDYVQHLREHGKKKVARQLKLTTLMKRAEAVLADVKAAAARVRADRMLPFEVYDGQVQEMAMQLHGGLNQLNNQLQPFGLAVPSWIVAGVQRWTDGTPGKPQHGGLQLEARLKALDDFDELVGALAQWLEEAKQANPQGQ